MRHEPSCQLPSSYKDKTKKEVKALPRQTKLEVTEDGAETESEEAPVKVDVLRGLF